MICAHFKGQDIGSYEMAGYMLLDASKNCSFSVLKTDRRCGLFNICLQMVPTGFSINPFNFYCIYI